MKHYDAIVIGAGPAGSCAAAKLLQSNLNVLVLEKMEFPRFVIGESLLPQCMEYLEKLDLLKVVENQGFQLKTGAKFFNDDVVCDFEFSEAYTPGYNYTYQVQRSIFDKTLIDEVTKRGAIVKFKTTVTNFSNENKFKEITYQTSNERAITVNCKFVIDASGYGKVLPKLLDLNTPSKLKPKGAIYCHISDKNKPNGAADNIYIHAINDENAWIWSIPFSDETASFGVVGDVELIKRFESNNYKEFHNLIKTLPVIKERFFNAESKVPAKAIYNYSSSVKNMFGNGYVLCGNATEFLDPIFSSGATLAIISGYKAAELAVKEINNEAVNWQSEYVDEIKHGISVFRSYVNAWYDSDLKTIFYSPEIRQDYKEQICSVLAGYVWDKSNPFVKKHKSILKTLSFYLAGKN